jgi:hypothetical protein
VTGREQRLRGNVGVLCALRLAVHGRGHFGRTVVDERAAELRVVATLLFGGDFLRGRRIEDAGAGGGGVDAQAGARMALTQKKLQDLKDASLSSLLQDDLAAWKAKARHAYVATHAYIKEIRPDDVTALLIAELEVTPEFRNCLARKKLKQKYWSEWFAELIIDRFWSELSGG